MNDRHESRLVLATVRERWDLVDRLMDEASPRPEVFLDVARECDVVPWIHALLEVRGTPDRFGSEIADGLAAGRHKCRMDNLLLLARVEQALDLMLAADIVPVALKGLDLMHRFDRGLDTRTLTDVDLLLRAEEVLRALDVLEEAGWILPPAERRPHWLRSSHHIPFSSAGPVEVEFEIHWNLV
ncbi:MAG: nucleotidyltransferase family protein, partial [Acidobacteriota bacterium]|nr:nucleotidyltransferase family protein [Acidobacteriota bacterium]